MIVSFILKFTFMSLCVESIKTSADDKPCDMSPEALNIAIPNAAQESYKLASSDLQNFTTQIDLLGSGQRPVWKYASTRSPSF